MAPVGQSAVDAFGPRHHNSQGKVHKDDVEMRNIYHCKTKLDEHHVTWLGTCKVYEASGPLQGSEIVRTLRNMSKVKKDNRLNHTA